MTDRIYSAAISAVAVIAAAVVDVNGKDPAPYLAVATLALGYYVGHAVQKARNDK